MLRNLDQLFMALRQSEFRSGQKLGTREARVLADKSLSVVCEQARQIVRQRLGAAIPRRDGRQTPWRGHPVFVAQHATATCCRGCLEKWHFIGRGQPLTNDQVDYIVAVIRQWLRLQPRPQSSQLRFAWDEPDE